MAVLHHGIFRAEFLFREDRIHSDGKGSSGGLVRRPHCRHGVCRVVAYAHEKEGYPDGVGKDHGLLFKELCLDAYRRIEFVLAYLEDVHYGFIDVDGNGFALFLVHQSGELLHHDDRFLRRIFHEFDIGLHVFREMFVVRKGEFYH
ncbi:hypothetical protein SDC9_201548 [bioreactor metagenome]|uniref:Uncharacterized protein n=1 Tax=bioreactor metagenome TaxID=1076179 RepID=A0A645ISG9_9ZZZZ